MFETRRQFESWCSKTSRNSELWTSKHVTGSMSCPDTAISYGTVNICVTYVRMDSLHLATASVVTRQQQNTHVQTRPIRIALHDPSSTRFSVTSRVATKQNEHRRHVLILCLHIYDHILYCTQFSVNTYCLKIQKSYWSDKMLWEF
jgi:hypothetical protein